MKITEILDIISCAIRSNVSLTINRDDIYLICRYDDKTRTDYVVEYNGKMLKFKGFKDFDNYCRREFGQYKKYVEF